MFPRVSSANLIPSNVAWEKDTFLSMFGKYMHVNNIS